MSAGDPLASEQDALLRQYYLSRGTRDTTSRWSADGPKSISPFVPCCASRIPTVLRAARLMPDDVLWDLGCGDGRLLHHAAGQYGCRCVGVDIDAPCIAEAKQRAVEQRVAHLCEFATCDLTALEPGALRPSPSAADGCVTLGAAALGDDDSSDGDAVRQRLPAPTCVLIFITSHGLTRLEQFLHREWAAGGLRIVTCVESLASCFDFESEDPLFAADEGRHEWPIYDAHAQHGVYVTPPCGTSVEAWAELEPLHLPRMPPTPAELDASEDVHANFALIDQLLSSAERRAIDEIGARCAAAEEGAEGGGVPVAAAAGDDDGGALSSFLFASETAGASDLDVISRVEDCMHAAKEHRVVHLHRHGAFQAELPRLLETVLARVRAVDAGRWRLLVGRVVHIRSIEWHVYHPGGAVSATDHRDTGSLLTLSALLTQPDEYEGARFQFPIAPQGIAGAAAAAVSPALACGDAVLFPSETRHSVSTLLKGERRSFVIELWEGPPNQHNRHR